MNVSELMQRKVEVIKGDTTEREAARRMSQTGVGVLPVTDNDRIIGMLTDRDIVIRSIARGDDPDKTRAADAMTREVAWCFETDSIEDASKKMSERQVQRLIVLNAQKRLVGILSLGDLARGRGDDSTISQALGEIKGPTKPSAAGASAQQGGH
jgi:CBS domain-containing protein